MTYFGQFDDDPYYMTAEEEQEVLRVQQVRYCKCAFTDSDGTVVPGELCPLHPPGSI